MQEKILEDIRNEIETRKNLANKKRNRLIELEKDEKVKEYLKLREIGKSNIKEYKIDEDKVIMDMFFNEFLDENDETNNIYYETDYAESDSKNKDRYMFLYTDIENGKKEFVNVDNVAEFENTHNVLETEVGYNKVQEEFIIDAVKNNQEDAVKRIIKKYGK